MAPRLRSPLGVVLVTVAALVLPATATAQESPIEGVPGIDQYVEEIPSAAGPKPVPQPRPTPGGGGAPPPAPLPESTRAAIARDGGDDAPLLDDLASSPELGAPRTPPASGGDEGAAEPAPAAGAASERDENDEPSETATPPAESPGVGEAAAEAITEGGAGSILFTAALLGLTALVLGSVWTRRFRR